MTAQSGKKKSWPFEEEEEGTGIASDVVKVQGEDPDTSKGGQGEVRTSAISDRGCISLGSLRVTMKPRDRT